MRRVLVFCSGLLAVLPGLAQAALSSPDQRLTVQVRVTPDQQLVYSVQREGQAVLLDSRLGLQLEGADLASGLRLHSSSAIKPQRERYTLAVGKRSRIEYRANEQVYRVANGAGQQMQIVFRVSNDGVAFRYVVAEKSLPRKVFKAELSSFSFAPTTRAWLQPMSVAQTGWSRVNPAYEELYQMDIAVGTASPSPAGWVFPALFKSGDSWVALSEANMDGSFHASRLQADSAGGEYRMGLPMAAEVFTGGRLLAEVTGTLQSPWRLLAIGSLKTVMESTLGTDLAAPAIAFDKSAVKPGHAAWSWALLKDDATVYEVQRRFIDYAADMGWNYSLIDADWDQKIGDAKLKQLVAHGRAKGVGILVWYNSSGDWNDTKYTPKSALLTAAQRRAEFARMKALGVKGLKIDFFNGDGQSMIQYYVDILKDAAAAGLLVNFHGATLPRGWARTYPNFMTAEAVKGFEFGTFEQKDQDPIPRHLAMLPFARNLFDPMDFTPMVFGDIPNIKRRQPQRLRAGAGCAAAFGHPAFRRDPRGHGHRAGRCEAALARAAAAMGRSALPGRGAGTVPGAGATGRPALVCGRHQCRRQGAPPESGPRLPGQARRPADRRRGGQPRLPQQRGAGRQPGVQAHPESPGRLRGGVQVGMQAGRKQGALC